MDAITDLISSVNKNKFLSEFTFVEQKVDSQEGEEEIADCIIWFDDCIVLYQLKGRDTSSIAEYSSEERWFINKVKKWAKQQVKKSVGLYDSADIITVKNLKGHKFDIKNGQIKKIYKIIIYKHETMIAIGLTHYCSRDVGFIHIFDSEDYRLACDVLDTPSEIFEYLEFREKLLASNILFNPLTEKNMLGAFIEFDNYDEFCAKILSKSSDVVNLLFEEVVDKLISDKDSYDINYILKTFEDKIYTKKCEPTSYYKILVELSKMNRTERRSFKERWEKCSEHVMTKNEFLFPYRMIATTTNCGFIFIPLVSEDFEKRLSMLNSLTRLSKYDLKLKKHIGASFCARNNFVYVDYIYTDFVWKYEKELTEKLKDVNPFRPLKERKTPRYFVRN